MAPFHLLFMVLELKAKKVTRATGGYKVKMVGL